MRSKSVRTTLLSRCGSSSSQKQLIWTQRKEEAKRRAKGPRPQPREARYKHGNIQLEADITIQLCFFLQQRQSRVFLFDSKRPPVVALTPLPSSWSGAPLGWIGWLVSSDRDRIALIKDSTKAGYLLQWSLRIYSKACKYLRNNRDDTGIRPGAKKDMNRTFQVLYDKLF